MTKGFDANPAFVASDQAALRLDPSGFNRGECERLLADIRELLHPFRGFKRGIIDRDERGKGGKDADTKMIPVRVGEIRKVHDALARAAQGIEAAIADETQSGSAEGESPVAKPCAQDTPPSHHQS